jgi:hypothetical protein
MAPRNFVDCVVSTTGPLFHVERRTKRRSFTTICGGSRAKSEKGDLWLEIAFLQ